MQLQPLQIKAVMLDMARVTERHEHYRALAPRLARWGYNALILHFNDDQGCAMAFGSRPELATPHAFTQEQMRDFISLCRDHGLMVIPEIECFGHTRFIHGLDQYAHLRESTTGQFNALNPLHPQTHQLLDDIVGETLEVFDAPLVHAGLDEVNFGGSEEVRDALKTKEKYEIFADHVISMHKRITGAGRRMMMWDDHISRPGGRGEPRIGELIPKDIILAHWLYGRHMPPRSLDLMLDQGFDVMCAPASLRHGEIVMPTATTQVNLQRFAHVAHNRGPKIVGLINTVWETGRELCGIEQFALALGGAWFSDPGKDPDAVLQSFACEQFGLDDAAASEVGPAILRLSANMPPRDKFYELIEMTEAETPANPLTACEVREVEQLRDQARAGRSVLLSFRDSVAANPADYDNYMLAADLQIWAADLALARTEGYPGRTKAALIERGGDLLDRCRADWNRGRYEDDPKRDAYEDRGRQFIIPNLIQALGRLGGSKG